MCGGDAGGERLLCVALHKHNGIGLDGRWLDVRVRLRRKSEQMGWYQERPLKRFCRVMFIRDGVSSAVGLPCSSLGYAIPAFMAGFLCCGSNDASSVIRSPYITVMRVDECCVRRTARRLVSWLGEDLEENMLTVYSWLCAHRRSFFHEPE